MFVSNESVLADIVREPILQWFRDNIAEMLIAAVIAFILHKLHLFKLARLVLEYTGVKVK